MLTVCVKYGADFEVRFNPADPVYIVVVAAFNSDGEYV